MSVHLSMCTSIELAMDNDRSVLCVHSQNQVQLLHDWGGSQNLTITLCHCSCPASAHGLLLLSLNPSCWCRVFPAECSTMPKWSLQACHTFVICGVHASVFIWVFWENVDPGMMVYILFEYVISPMWICMFTQGHVCVYWNWWQAPRLCSSFLCKIFQKHIRMDIHLGRCIH